MYLFKFKARIHSPLLGKRKQFFCNTIKRFYCVVCLPGLAKRVGARLLLASTSEVYGGKKEDKHSLKNLIELVPCLVTWSKVLWHKDTQWSVASVCVCVCGCKQASVHLAIMPSLVWIHNKIKILVPSNHRAIQESWKKSFSLMLNIVC